MTTKLALDARFQPIRPWEFGWVVESQYRAAMGRRQGVTAPLVYGRARMLDGAMGWWEFYPPASRNLAREWECQEAPAEWSARGAALLTARRALGDDDPNPPWRSDVRTLEGRWLRAGCVAWLWAATEHSTSPRAPTSGWPGGVAWHESGALVASFRRAKVRVVSHDLEEILASVPALYFEEAVRCLTLPLPPKRTGHRLAAGVSP